jgi:hypothetical protein
VKRDGRIGAKRVPEVALLEGDDPARPHSTSQGAEKFGGVRHVHQHPAADDGIVEFAKVDVRDVAVSKLDVRPTGGFHTSARGVQDVGVCVHSDHPALGADELGQRHGDVARPAADVEHFHSLGDAS